jgi:hypothetical protein
MANEDLRSLLAQSIKQSEARKRVERATDFSKNLALENRIEIKRSAEEAIAKRLMLGGPLTPEQQRGAGGTGGGAPVGGKFRPSGQVPSIGGAPANIQDWKRYQAPAAVAPTSDDILTKMLQSDPAKFALGGFEKVQKYYTGPASTMLGLALGTLGAPEGTGIPQLGRDFRSGIREARESGANPLEALLAGYKKSQETDLASFTVSLPGSGIPLPDSVFGDRTLDDIQFGIRGALEVGSELPAEILVGRGGLASINKGLKLAKNARKSPDALRIAENLNLKKKPYLVMKPESEEWISLAQKRPDLVDEMAVYANRIQFGEAGFISTNTDDILGYLDVKPPKKPGLIDRAGTVATDVQKFLLDHNVRLNQTTSRVRNTKEEWKKKYGESLPDDLNLEAHAALLPGITIGAKGYAISALKNMRNVANKAKINLNEIDRYLKLKNQEEILKLNPDRKSPFPGINTLDDVQAELAKFSARHGNEGYANVIRVASHYINFLDEMMEDMVQNGLVNPDLAKYLRTERPHYHPIKYVEELENEVADATRGIQEGLTNNDSGLKRLADLGAEGVLENPTDIMMSYALKVRSLGARNSAAKAGMEAFKLDPKYKNSIRKLNVGDKPNIGEKVIHYLQDGKVVAHAVPEDVFNMLKGMQEMGGAGGVLRFGRMSNAVTKALVTTLSPAFLIKQSLQDMLAVAVHNGVLPHSVAASAIRIMGQKLVKDPFFEQMMRDGGAVSGWWGETPEAIIREAKKRGDIVVSDKKSWDKLLMPLKGLNAIKDGVYALGHALEMAPRRAVTMDALEKGTPRKQAILLGRRATVDFQRAGTAVKFLNNFYMFLNPAVQGFLVPGRAFRDNPAARIGIGTFLGASAALELYNRQYPEYLDIPLRERYGAISIMLPSKEYKTDGSGDKKPNRIVLVPNKREFAAISLPMQYAVGRMMDEEPATWGQVLDVFLKESNPAGPVTGSYAVPTQPGRMASELYRNKNSFTGRPIVPESLINLPEEEQFDERTSPTAIRLGKSLGFSPMKIDYLLQVGVFREAMLLTDAAIRRGMTGVDPQLEAIANNLKNFMVEADAEGNLINDPDTIKRVRADILNDLSKEDAEIVSELIKEDEPLISLGDGPFPLLNTLAETFLKDTGGGYWNISLERAARNQGITPEDWYRTLEKTEELQEEITDIMIDADKNFLSTDPETVITGKQWREQRKLRSMLSQTALSFAAVHNPNMEDVLTNASTRSAFYKDIATAAGSAPDKRTKEAILLAGYYSIKPRKLGDGTDDMNHFFDMRKEYIEILPSEDQEQLLLNIRKNNSDLENEFEKGLLRNEDYFKIEETHFRDADGNLNDDAYQFYKDWIRLDENQKEQYKIDNPHRRESIEDIDGPENAMLRAYNPGIQAMIEQDKQAARANDAQLDAFLYKWEYTDKLLHPNNQTKWQTIAPWRVTQLGMGALVPFERQTTEQRLSRQGRGLTVAE